MLSGAITSLVVLINYLLPQSVWSADGAGGSNAAVELDYDLHGASAFSRGDATSGA